jgi:transcriptional regulator of arginine metabolism
MVTNASLEAHILNIVQNHEILEQNDLQKMLKALGYNVPQATLSRHLKRLKIAKVSGVYKAVDLYKPNLPVVLHMQISEFGLIVLHTHPGQANSLAYFFDQEYVNYSSKSIRNTGILGTIAGDDTVLLIIKSSADMDAALSIIHQEFPYLNSLTHKK